MLFFAETLVGMKTSLLFFFRGKFHEIETSYSILWWN